MMSMFEYWREAVECALEDAEAFGVLTGEQIAVMAKAMANASECAGMADGRECIPNPERAEQRRVRAGHAAEVARLEANATAYANAFARCAGVDPRKVYLHYGDVRVLR